MGKIYKTGSELVFEFAGVQNPHKPNQMGLWAEDKRLSHYTSVESVLKILESGKLWLTNIGQVNDYTEVSYGMELFSRAYSRGIAKEFEIALGNVFDIEAVEEVMAREYSSNHLIDQTYISCLSEQHEVDDKSGKQLMWNQYGDTAIVFNANWMLKHAWEHKVFVAKVEYIRTEDDLKTRFSQAARTVEENSNGFELTGVEYLESVVQAMKVIFAASTKNPFFSGENEIRLAHLRLPGDLSGMKEGKECSNGISRSIWEYPIIRRAKNEPESDHWNNVIDRIMIGPKEGKKSRFDRVTEKLRELGIPDYESKVAISEAPLRH